MRGWLAGLLLLIPAAVGAAAPPAPPQPQWLVVLTLARPELRDLKAWTAADQQAVQAHFERLQALAAKGVVIVAGRTQDLDADGKMPVDALGILIFEAPDRTAAEAIMNGDPAIVAGVMRGRLSGYKVAASRNPADVRP